MTKTARCPDLVIQVSSLFRDSSLSFVIKFTLLSRRFLPFESGSRVRPEEQTLCRRRFSRSWPHSPQRSPLYRPYRPPLRLPLSLSGGNRPCIRCRDKFRCVLSAGQILSLRSPSFPRSPARRALLSLLPA